MSYELCKCNIGIVWLVGGLGYSVKPLVRPHVLILTVGDTPSTDDQVFVCQLGNVIEVRYVARITLKYLFALCNVGGSTAALSCIWRVTNFRWKSFSFGVLIDIDYPTSGPLSIFT